MKNLLSLVLILTITGVNAQCPDGKSNEYQKKAQQYNDVSYTTLATYYYYKCQCENGIDNRTPEQVNTIVDHYNNLKSNKAGSNSISIEGQHKVQWVNISKVSKCSKSNNSSTQKEKSKKNKNSISNKVSNQVNDISNDLSNGDISIASNKSIVMATEGILDGNNKQIVGGLALGLVSLFSNKSTSDYTMKNDAGFWQKYTKGISIFSNEKDFEKLIAYIKYNKNRPDVGYLTNEYLIKYYFKKGNTHNFGKLPLSKIENLDLVFERSGSSKIKILGYPKNNRFANEEYEDNRKPVLFIDYYYPEYKEIRYNKSGQIYYEHIYNVSNENYNISENINYHKTHTYPNGITSYNIKFQPLNGRKLLANKSFKTVYQNNIKMYVIETNDDSCVSEELKIYKPNGEISHTEYISTRFNCFSNKPNKFIKYKDKYYDKKYDRRNGATYYGDIFYNKPQEIIRYWESGKIKTKVDIELMGRKKVFIKISKYNQEGDIISKKQTETSLKEFNKGFLEFLYI